MQTIVVGVDGSAVADDALRWAVDEAKLRDAQVEVVYGYIVHIGRTRLATPDSERAEQTMAQVLERNADVLQGISWTSTLAPLMGRPYADAVLGAADDADLTVVGSRGLGGFKELLLGSTSYKVAVHAPVPVAVVPQAADGVRGDPGRIVVGVDGSPGSRRALQWAVDDAALRQVDVTVVHGFFAPDEELASGLATANQISLQRERAQTEAHEAVDGATGAITVPDGVKIVRQVVEGTPAGAVLSTAGPDDLIVVGTRGRGVVRRALLGSTGHQVLHHTKSVVVVVP